MLNKKATLILSISASIVLFILTFINFSYLFEFMMPEVENAKYQTTKLGSQFKIRLIFSIINGLIPIFLYLTWKFGRIELKSRRILSGFIVTTFIAIAILIRQQLIKSSIVTLANLKTETGENIYNVIHIENLNFEYYLLGGLILGCVVSFFTLKDK